jgi:hypothetical protein
MTDLVEGEGGTRGIEGTTDVTTTATGAASTALREETERSGETRIPTALPDQKSPRNPRLQLLWQAPASK